MRSDRECGLSWTRAAPQVLASWALLLREIVFQLKKGVEKMRRSHSIDLRHLVQILLVLSLMVSTLVVAPPPAEATDGDQHKILFIAGYALLGWRNELVKPVSGWSSIKSFLQTSPPARDLDLEEDDFLYYSYSGNYEKTADGSKDYTQPRYRRLHTRFRLGADYSGRAEHISEIISAYPDAEFTIIGHSLGGVIATYWAATRPVSPVPGGDPLASRVSSIITLDSPLQGTGGPCGVPGIVPIPSEVISALPDAVQNLRILTVRNIDDTLVPYEKATLPGVWRDLVDHLGAGEGPCSPEGHSSVRENLVVQWHIVAAMLAGQIYMPTTTRPALAGPHDSPTPITVRVFHYADEQASSKDEFTVRIGGKDAEVLGFADKPDFRTYELEIMPPPQAADGLYDLTVVLRSESDTNSQAVRYGPTGAATSTVLVMDVSGSMGETWQGGVKIESAKSAATRILNMIERESEVAGIPHHVAIATFTTDATLELAPTTNYDEARSAVSRLAALHNTNLGAGLEVANGELARAAGDSKGIIILLSDGLTNTGMTPAQILNGPVAEAAAAGTCIYTIGFGDPGALDEDLLRRIAHEAACGEYYYASTGYDLENVYIKARHQSIGTIIAEFSGQVAQGQTVTAGEASVDPGQEELGITLNWMGSKLDLVLTDPSGRQVDQDYPGASIFIEARPVYFIIENPRPGIWQVSVVGGDVPEGTTRFNVILSTRQRMAPPDFTGLFMVTTLTLGLAIAAVFLVGRSQGWPIFAPARVGLAVIGRTGPRSFVGFRRQTLTVGRHPANDLVLQDEKVSRTHARIIRTPEGYIIEDLKSANGSFVNERKITRQVLKDGDEIRVGDTRLRFQVTERERRPFFVRRRAGLLVVGPAGRTTFVGFRRDMLTIGRDPSNILVLPDKKASKHHARVMRAPEGYVVEDLESTNGTFVNGERVDRKVLRDGDEIRVGDTSLRFRAS